MIKSGSCASDVHGAINNCFSSMPSALMTAIISKALIDCTISRLEAAGPAWPPASICNLADHACQHSEHPPNSCPGFFQTMVNTARQSCNTVMATMRTNCHKPPVVFPSHWYICCLNDPHDMLLDLLTNVTCCSNNQCKGSHNMCKQLQMHAGAVSKQRSTAQCLPEAAAYLGKGVGPKASECECCCNTTMEAAAL